jgi:beta-lactamase class A
LNGDQPGLLASVVKLFVLVEAFTQIETGCIRLEDRWCLPRQLKQVGSGILTELDDNLPLTVRDLLTLMLIISDNTATDILFERLGVEKINAHIHSLGFTNSYIVNTMRQHFDKMLPSADPVQDRQELARWEAANPMQSQPEAYSVDETNNTSTPWDLVRLLEMIYKEEIHTPASCQSMLKLLLKQQLNDRLPRFLPAGTKVAHKTGTYRGVRNDAGIIYAGDHSHIAIAILASWDQDSVRANRIEEVNCAFQIDCAMAKIGLVAYEAYKM